MRLASSIRASFRHIDSFLTKMPTTRAHSWGSWLRTAARTYQNSFPGLWPMRTLTLLELWANVSRRSKQLAQPVEQGTSRSVSGTDCGTIGGSICRQPPAPRECATNESPRAHKSRLSDYGYHLLASRPPRISFDTFQPQPKRAAKRSIQDAEPELVLVFA